MPIVLQKDPEQDEHGNILTDMEGKQLYRCGFKIGGGIDQDPAKSPQGYPDKGIYITFVYENSPAFHAGLQVHDKILQVNGHDMTVVMHKKAVEYIKRKPVLNLMIYRKGMPNLQKPGMTPQQQQQQMPPGNYPSNFPQQQQQQFQTFAPSSPQMQHAQFQQSGY